MSAEDPTQEITSSKYAKATTPLEALQSLVKDLDELKYDFYNIIRYNIS